ncbi:MAG: TonB family protein [Candidatus Acidiferrales bacterium]
MQTAVSILMPTKDVDFDSYINRLLATIKRNWYAVMPESAMMGEEGFVVLKFHIQRDGKIPDADPTLVHRSGSKQFDDVAVAAVQTSTPFEPLPDAFRGPNIELRFFFIYNAGKSKGPTPKGPTPKAPTPNGPTHSGDCENNPPSDPWEPRLVPLAQPPAARICNVN